MPFDKLTVLSRAEGLTILSKVEGLMALSKAEGAALRFIFRHCGVLVTLPRWPRLIRHHRHINKGASGSNVCNVRRFVNPMAY